MPSLVDRRLLAGLSLVALVAAAPALSATLEAPSRIDSVTVYPDAATVTRLIEVDLPAGATSLVLRGLPIGLDPASLRVTGEGGGAIAIGGVESRVAPTDAPKAGEGVADKLKTLRDERDAIQVRIEALEGKRAMVQRYAEASPEKLGPESAPLDIEKWSAAWNAVGGELARTAEEARVAKVALREAEERIRALEASTRRPEAPRPARDVIVSLDAPAATKAKLTVAYRVGGAGWRPLYDARLTNAADGKASIELVRRAEVRQRTGEDWTNVQLSVSTARVQRGVQAPEMFSERLVFWEPPVVMQRSAPAPAGTYADLPAPMSAKRENAPPAPPVAAVETEATLDAGAYQAVFRAPGRADVTGDGAQRALRIGSSTLPADLTVRITPAIDQTAYLYAAFVNTDEAPILPGEVSLQRDGVFVGRGRIELAPPGARVRLGFGADDRVQVTRAPVRRTENEPTWLGSNKQEARDFRTVVKNLHPFAINATVVDRVPISENTAITIEQLPATTAPTDKAVEGRRGVLGWTFDLAPGASKEIRLAYRMRWPADRAVNFETVPDEGGGGDRPVPLPRPAR